ncbi:alpha-galactosidase [uncultured Thomasclavelia sp.]|uniref:alpha-galactosidase n=1 Tax=uncultured Thomasclavelia sp. TaxID=3025759 RepID=UPI0025E89083|nr:alpha-galactosidase [uncultured Thomasclavelia sp.]
MAIIFHDNSKTFHLYNDEISYIIKILPNHQLGQLYYGKKIKDRDNFDHLLELRHRPMAVCTFENDQTFSLEHLKQEYPVYGSGDMRYPAIDIVLENGSRILDFTYQSHQILNGKVKLEQLPATYVEDDDEATTLIISLYDSVIACQLELMYTIYNDYPVITRSAKIINQGFQTIKLNAMMSLALDLPDSNYTMLELTGAWARERYIKERKLQHGIQAVYSLRGASSHNYNPFLALKRNNCDEFSGEVLGFSFVYSGNFLAQVEVDTYDTTRVLMGIHPHCFSWNLTNTESFQTPEVVMVYSDQGLNKMSRTYHSLYQKRLVRGYHRDLPRPILINSWEGTYFDFDEEKIIQMAKKAQKLGIELFVLDDGWFGHRNDDHSSLGDWFVNLDKLPDGIGSLATQIHDLGLQFGLWFEPEMVSYDSNLYRQHPNWLLKTPDRRLSHGRNQYVLDFSNPEVVTYIYDLMVKIIEEAQLDYIKWDMNRSMSEVYSSSHSNHDQGRVMHEYILGVYQLYERLIQRFPRILFESCASGGGRFDPGMLYYAPQAWASDDSDAIERLKIQYGTSLVYPLSSIGSHVSAIPNHQVFRNTPIETRANVAYFGTFGYELDISCLSLEEEDKIKEQIAFMKEYRSIIQFGSFYRLLSPFENDGNETAWMVVSKDQKMALVGYYRTLLGVNLGYRRLKLQGLNPDYLYHVSLLESDHYGDELMNIGLINSDHASGENHEVYNGANGDYYSKIYVIKAK